MDWKPKTAAHKLYMEVIVKFLEDNEFDTKKAAEHFDLSVEHIRRYARAAGINLRKTRKY